ncbi:MAG: hypothetical protein ACXADD_17380 [Candidatus Thorarchaeota archaeon]|jgi:uncharacterized protein YwgA
MSSEIDLGESETSHTETEKQEFNNSRIPTAILTLLAANDGSSVRGRIMLVKQIFIMAKEILPELSEPMHFFPYQWGPYSNVVANAVNQLVDDELVSVEKDGREDIFKLTSTGMKAAEKVAKSLPEDVILDIAKMKRTTQEVGLRRVLQFIYSNYPQYAVHSRGKEIYGPS